MTRAALAAAGFVRHELDGTIYWSAGTGSTLVLVHGANDQAGTWFTVAPALARTHRVLIPDLPGHGETPPKTGPIPLSLILERLEALLSDERDFTLAGNSLGGWLVLLYALRHQERISRLVLESSGGLSRPLSSPLFARDREEALLILRNVHGPSFSAPEWVIEALLQRATDSPMLRLTETLEHQIEDRLGEIRVPATLIWGAQDGVLPLDYAHALQKAIPGATLHVIEGAAHIPHMQQPERFLQCLTAIS
ncbi:MAG TPA: alpha/beta fold hydrolase [Thermoanaerobaculia bacterium]|nr:alpha/beta fold hydrolase [Thermoanaerobaculia bacterium]